MEKWASNNESIVNARILSQDKQETYYSLTAGPTGKKGNIDDSLMLPVSDNRGTIVGYLNLSIDFSGSLSKFNEKTLSFLFGAGILFLVGLLAIGIFYRTVPFLSEGHQIEKKKILVFLVVLVFILQAAFTGYTYITLKGFYLEISQNTASEVQRMVEADLEQVLKQGVRYEQIYQFQEYAEEVVKQAPVLEQITLNGSDLRITVSQDYIKGMLRRMLIDLITILVTAMFIVAEIVNFMIISINRKAENLTGIRIYDKRMSIRVSSFFIHVACYLPISFIPIMMYQYTGEKASDFVLGLPIMVFFASSFIFTILAGSFNLRFGWKAVLKAGVLLVIISSLMAGFLQHPALLVVARGIYGAAYALVYVAIREYAALSQDRQERSRGLAEVTAGLYAGINIGAVLGSMIFSNAGFSGVFLLSAVLGGLSYWIIAKHCETEALEEQAESEQKGLAPENPFRPYLDGRLIRLALFIIAPLAITGLFFEYFLPVYAVKIQMPSGDIGRAFLVNGLAIAYLSPILVQRFARKLPEQVTLVLFMLLMGAGFLVFGIWGSYFAILVASAVMGVAEGTALVSQNMILLDLPAAKQLGTSRMLSFYAAVRKLAQTAGPQIFALYMVLGYQTGMAIFGATIGLTTMLYALSGWRPSRGGSA